MKSNQQQKSDENNSSNQKLTLLVKRYVDIIWYLGIATLIVWFFAIMVIGYSIPDNPDERHTDITFGLQFRVLPVGESLDADEQTNLSEIIQGTSNLKLNNTKSYLSWYVSNAIILISGLIGIWAWMFVRKIFHNLVNKEPFHERNQHYLYQLGLIIFISNLIIPILVYLGGLFIISDIGQFANHIKLFPAVEINVMSLFIGLALIILSKIFQEATTIHEEQSLTI